MGEAGKRGERKGSPNQGGRAAAVDRETGFRPRRDGFSAEKRKVFLDALAEYGTLSDAARVAGVSTNTVRRHEDRDPDFASLIRAARAKAGSSLEVLAWERGVTGIEEEVIHYGKKVGTRRKRSDSVFRMILMASDPEKWGRIGGGETAAQMEKRLRKRIEREVRERIAAEQPSVEQVTEKILRKVAAIRRHRERYGSPAGEEDGSGAANPGAEGGAED